MCHRVIPGGPEGSVWAAQEVGCHARGDLVVDREVVDRLDLLLRGLRTVDPPPAPVFGRIPRPLRHFVPRMRRWLLDPVEAVIGPLQDPVDLQGRTRDPLLGGPLAGRLLAETVYGTPMSSAYNSRVSRTPGNPSPEKGTLLLPSLRRPGVPHCPTRERLARHLGIVPDARTQVARLPSGVVPAARPDLSARNSLVTEAP